MAGSGSSGAWRRWLPAVAPVALALVVLWLGHPLRAAVLVGVAVVVAVLVLLGLPVDRWIMRAAVAVANAIGWVLTMLVGLGMVLVGGVLRLVGVDPLTPRAQSGNGWHATAPASVSDELSSSPFGAEHGAVAGTLAEPRGRRWARRSVLALGTVTALLLADLGIGLVWERLAPEQAAFTDAVNVTGTAPTADDPRADLPAMAPYPWAREYFREAASTRVTYWPFTETRPLPFHGRYVNVDGWARRTYEPAAAASAPVVWMFGGSTTWGEGQRDEHTIASDVARLAERDGTPVRVVNYGQRGWSHFQEMVLFEQLVAAGEPPDLAVFYDGANELNSQALSAKGVPSHTLADDYATTISGGIDPAVDGNRTSLVDQAVDAWEEHSAIRKVVRFLDDHVVGRAGAMELTSGIGVGRTDVYDPTTEDAQRAVDVYQRGRSITEFVAREHGVQPVFFWQPTQSGPPMQWANEHVGPPTVNLSDALDGHGDVYIDGGHTNEAGALLVAERIWSELRGLVGRSGRTPTTTEAPPTTGPTPSTSAPASSVAPPTGMSEAAAVARARAALDAAGADACAIRGWKVWLGALRASSPASVASIGDLAGRFLHEFAAAAPRSASSDAAVVEDLAGRVAGLLATTAYDPDRPLVPQLPAVADDSSTFLRSFSAVDSAIGARCASGR